LWRKKMAATEGYITMDDGVRLFYQAVGNGEKTLLILNGYFLFNDFKYLGDGRTVIAIDVRNRGRSDYITDPSKLQRGIHQDVDNIEYALRHFALATLDLLWYSHAGIMPVLDDITSPERSGS